MAIDTEEPGAYALMFTNSDDGERICRECGAMVRDSRAHYNFHVVVFALLEERDA